MGQQWVKVCQNPKCGHVKTFDADGPEAPAAYVMCDHCVSTTFVVKSRWVKKEDRDAVGR